MKDPSEYHPSDIHGQLIFNYRHKHITQGQEGEYMLRAFNRDFQLNGPSTLRIVRTVLQGWQRYKNHPDQRIRRRHAWAVRELATTFSAAVAGAKLYYRRDPHMYAKMSALLTELHREFGWKSRLFSALGGRYVLAKLRSEEKRLAAGWTYEPPTFYEKNAACGDLTGAAACRYVTPRVARPKKLVPTTTDALLVNG